MNSVYLMGIGGIGMANLAVLLKQAGYHVSGSDGAVYDPASSILRTANITVYSPYSESNLPKKNIPIIVGNAISRGNVEIEAALRDGLSLYSFPEILNRRILSERKRIVIAGTHGKSTTTACLAHLLVEAGDDPGFLVGASPLNFDSGSRLGKGKPFVVEGDEYDSAFFDKRSKFLHYFPDILVLGAVEFDHADIFSDLDDMLLSYRRLINLLPDNGTLIYYSGNQNAVDLARYAPCRTVSVGHNEQDDWQLLQNDSLLSWRSPDKQTHSADFIPIGKHNRLNALMSLAASSAYKESALYQKKLSSFLGIRRRLEKLHDSNGCIIYDDFAHHPTAVYEAIKAVRTRYPERKLIGIFEPRSNTSVRNIFQKEFTESFAQADVIVLGSIHRSEKIPVNVRFDVNQIISDLNVRGVTALQAENSEILRYLNRYIETPSVFLFMSNGSFDNLPRRFAESLMRNPAAVTSQS